MSKNKAIVISVYKSGGDFTAEYVHALVSGLHKFLPLNFEFWCLTDREEEVQDFCDRVITIHKDWPNWWCKIEMFRIIYPAESRVIYFDLDVMPLKSLTDFVNVLHNTKWGFALRSSDPVGIENNWMSSSIMSWYGNSWGRIYDTFNQQPKHHINQTSKNTNRAGQRTDQGFIRTIVDPYKFQDFLPDNYILFKNQYQQNNALFKEAHILNWTGKPRYLSMPEDSLIKRIWKQTRL